MLPGSRPREEGCMCRPELSVQYERRLRYVSFVYILFVYAEDMFYNIYNSYVEQNL